MRLNQDQRVAQAGEIKRLRQVMFAGSELIRANDLAERRLIRRARLGLNCHALRGQRQVHLVAVLAGREAEFRLVRHLQTAQRRLMLAGLIEGHGVGAPGTAVRRGHGDTRLDAGLVYGDLPAGGQGIGIGRFGLNPRRRRSEPLRGAA